MALSSISVFIVNELPEMTTTSIFALKRSPSCFLPLQKALQDQQMGLTQAAFKLLPLHWDLECVRFCMCPLRVASLFPTTLWLSHTQAPLALQSLTFWGPIFLV